MIIARVIGDIVAARKQVRQRPRKLVLIQPLNLDSTNMGETRTALDLLDTKVGDCVLVTKSAGGPGSPGDLAVVSLIQRIALHAGPAGAENK